MSLFSLSPRPPQSFVATLERVTESKVLEETTQSQVGRLAKDPRPISETFLGVIREGVQFRVRITRPISFKS